MFIHFTVPAQNSLLYGGMAYEDTKFLTPVLNLSKEVAAIVSPIIGGIFFMINPGFPFYFEAGVMIIIVIALLSVKRRATR